MQIEEGAEQSPPQAGPMGDGDVDVGDRRETLIDQVERLAPQGCLQAVGDVAFDLAADMDRLLADRGVEIQGPPDRLRTGELSADDLHKRDEVRGVERVPQKYPFRVARRILDVAD